MKYLIQYTSSAEGVTLGVLADSMVECLAGFTEQFGDGFMVLYNHTVDELNQTCAAVELSAAGELEQVRERTTAEAFERATRIVEHDEERDSSADEDGPDDLRGAGGDEAPVDGDLICSVCGVAIDDRMARYTEMMYGSTRCGGCIV